MKKTRQQAKNSAKWKCTKVPSAQNDAPRRMKVKA